MAVTVRGAGTVYAPASAATSYPVPLPSGVVSGETIFVLVTWPNGTTVTWSGAGGVIFNGLFTPSGTGSGAWLWVRATSNGQSSVTVTASASISGVARALVLSGAVASGNPYEVIGTEFGASTSVSISIPSITTVTADAMVIAGRWARHTSATTFSAPSGTTPTLTNAMASSVLDAAGTYCGICVDAGVLASPGATGARTAAVTPVTNRYGGLMISVPPEPPAELVLRVDDGNDQGDGTGGFWDHTLSGYHSSLAGDVQPDIPSSAPGGSNSGGKVIFTSSSGPAGTLILDVETGTASTATDLTAWVYVVPDRELIVSLLVQGASVADLILHDYDVEGWYSVTSSGTYDQADVDDTQIQFYDDPGGSGGFDQFRIYDAYVLVEGIGGGGGGGPTTYTRGASDSFTVGDAATRATLRPRAGADTVTVADSAARTRVTPRSASDAVTVGDTAARAATYPRAGTDAVSVADAAARSLIAARPAAGTYGIADAAARAITAARAATGTITLGDAAARSQAAARTANDTVTIGDTASLGGAQIRGASDSVTITDAATRAMIQARAAAASIALADSAARAVSYPRAAADSVTITDTPARLVARWRATTDSIQIGDAATRGVTYPRATASSISIADSAARSGTFSRGVLELVVLTTATTRQAIYARGGTDTVTIADVGAVRFEITVGPSRPGRIVRATSGHVVYPSRGRVVLR